LTLAALRNAATRGPAPSHETRTGARTAANPGLFSTPRKDRTGEQQSRDRYECHLWAVKNKVTSTLACRRWVRVGVFNISRGRRPGQGTVVGAVTGAVVGAAVFAPGR